MSTPPLALLYETTVLVSYVSPALYLYLAGKEAI